MSRTFRLGIFVVGALLVFGVGVFWIGEEQMLFRSKYRLNAEFRNVAGLTAGAQVRVSGVSTGTVRRIDLPQRPDQKVRVEMDLDSDTRKVIKLDSTAAIRAEGLMGDEYVEIAPGSTEAASVQDDGTLQGTQPVEISDLVQKADGILNTAGSAMQNVSQATGNLSSITSKIDDGKGTVGALVNDKQVYQNVNKATAELQEDMEAVKHNFLLSRFFRNRGYEDSTDLTKNGISQLPSEQAVKRFSWNAQQIFDKPDTAKLKDSKALNQAGEFLQANPFGLAVVLGFSDMKGDADKEKTLTEARALVVRDYLVKNFKMDDTRVKTLGLGKSSNAETAGISVLVYPSGFVPDGGTTRQLATPGSTSLNGQVGRGQ
jgi:phospholipid/cholesterol/gamma-HCH transport system substrate-binding protein